MGKKTDNEKIDLPFDRWLHEVVEEKVKALLPLVCDPGLFIERCVEAVLLNGEASFEYKATRGTEEVTDLKIYLPGENQYDDLEAAEI